MTPPILLQGDCLDLLPMLPDQSVDMVLADLPYGTTRNKWDSVIDLTRLWVEYRRICKGAIVLTAAQPFTSALVMSAIDIYRYDWVWVKPHTGQLNAKRQPLRNKEDVLVFSNGAPPYNPQFEVGEAYTLQRKGYKGSDSYGAQVDHTTVSDGRRYPKQLLHFAERGGLHPTQKPVALGEYLIRTYTDPGQVVLDNTMGSGSFGVAAVNTGRAFIGIERDDVYYAAACARIHAALG